METKTSYQKFKESHDINEQQTCTICDGHYTYYNKSHHNKSKKHQHALKLIESMNAKLTTARCFRLNYDLWDN